MRRSKIREAGRGLVKQFLRRANEPQAVLEPFFTEISAFVDAFNKVQAIGGTPNAWGPEDGSRSFSVRVDAGAKDYPEFKNKTPNEFLEDVLKQAALEARLLTSKGIADARKFFRLDPAFDALSDEQKVKDAYQQKWDAAQSKEAEGKSLGTLLDLVPTALQVQLGQFAALREDIVEKSEQIEAQHYAGAMDALERRANNLLDMRDKIRKCLGLPELPRKTDVPELRILAIGEEYSAPCVPGSQRDDGIVKVRGADGKPKIVDIYDSVGAGYGVHFRGLPNPRA